MTEIVNPHRFLDYAPAPESTSILHLKKSYGLFIDGEFVKGHGKPFLTVAPATEEKIAEIANANSKDVDAAVAAARRAYDRTWSKLSGADRGKYLFRIARLVQERARELAVAESIDNGKPNKESRDVDVPLVEAWFFYYAGWADKLDYAGLGPNPRALGVAAQVIPWNFPLLMLAWKIAPALAAGNTVVIKPAETTPLSSLILAEILQQAELPAGVVNIITGAGDTGQALVNHPDVNKVAFTGSTAVGRAIAKSVAGSGKKLTLELGGKAANIVFDDAPIDQAVEGIVNGIFFNQGHVCCAGSRLLVQENVHDEVVDRLKLRLSPLRLGDPLDKNTDIGAINSREQLERIRELSDIGEREGAERWTAPCVIPMSMLKEFKAFAMKGNLDLAVGFVMGAAFTAVSTTFIQGLVMPFISLIVQKDFSTWKLTLKEAEMAADGTVAKAEIAVLYGDFISALIYFLIVAFVMFLVVKAINKMKKKEEEAPAAPAGPTQEELLTQIRDLL